MSHPYINHVPMWVHPDLAEHLYNNPATQKYIMQPHEYDAVASSFSPTAKGGTREVVAGTSRGGGGNVNFPVIPAPDLPPIDPSWDSGASPSPTPPITPPNSLREFNRQNNQNNQPVAYDPVQVNDPNAPTLNGNRAGTHVYGGNINVGPAGQGNYSGVFTGAGGYISSYGGGTPNPTTDTVITDPTVRFNQYGVPYAQPTGPNMGSTYFGAPDHFQGTMGPVGRGDNAGGTPLDLSATDVESMKRLAGSQG